MIDGVIIKKLVKYEDERGWLSEVYRTDTDIHRPVLAYVSFTKNGLIRGPHEHKKQSDMFVFGSYGDYELYLWDNRKGSATFGKKMKYLVGESNPVSVVVPPGVVHGYKCVSKKGGLSVNLPDHLYMGEGKKEKVDEIRYEGDAGSEFKIE